jgi:hypothetical protein
MHVDLGGDKKKRSPAVAFVVGVIGCDINRSGRYMGIWGGIKKKGRQLLLLLMV